MTRSVSLAAGPTQVNPSPATFMYRRVLRRGGQRGKQMREALRDKLATDSRISRGHLVSPSMNSVGSRPAVRGAVRGREPGPRGPVQSPPEARHSRSIPSTGAPQDGLRISILRPFDSGAFGIRTRRTPFSKVAVTASADTVRGTLKERSKRPVRRSCRW